MPNPIQIHNKGGNATISKTGGCGFKSHLQLEILPIFAAETFPPATNLLPVLWLVSFPGDTMYVYMMKLLHVR
jgi:hypothetical protein